MRRGGYGGKGMDEVWSIGKGGGGGENGEVLRQFSLILFCIASACEHWPKYIHCYLYKCCVYTRG